MHVHSLTLSRKFTCSHENQSFENIYLIDQLLHISKRLIAYNKGLPRALIG